MSPEEFAVANELESILRSPNADAAYNAIPGSMSGKILNADLARELSPRFRSINDRMAFTYATYEPARDYVYDRYLRTIKQNRAKVAIILAGGAASGKSTSIRASLQSADLVFDSNCANFAKACRMIDAAVSGRWAVVVIYVHRNFKAAVEGMIDRALTDGRFIPLVRPDGDDLAKLHFSAQQTFLQLNDRYADAEWVKFSALRNPWTPDNPQGPAGISNKTLAPGGKRHYTSIEELYAIQQPIIQAHLAAKKLPEKLISSLGIA